MDKNVKIAISVKVAVAVATIVIVALLFYYKNASPPAPAVPPDQSAIRNAARAREAARSLRDRMKVGVADTSIPKTTMSFNEMSFNFGTVKDGDVVTHNLIFKNSGTNPLVIYNVAANCGCTAPGWPQNPIKPGETDTITLKYNSKGEAGFQNKTVHIYKNTKPMETDITFKANVIK